MKKIDDLLKNRTINYEELESFGFIKKENYYCYEKNILDDFKVIINVINDKVTSSIIEIDINEEYLPAYNENAVGEFVTSVRDKYNEVLKSFIDTCTTKDVYKSNQTKDVINYIKEKYNGNLEFLWEKLDSYAVIRNENNNKWYALIAVIDKSKLSKKESGNVEAINLRYQKDEVLNIIDDKSIFKGYHMNKDSWITVKLDNSLDTKEIFDLIDNSYNLVNKPNEWVIPANASYFDVEGYFDSNDIVSWRYIKNILPGDIVYVYIGVPYSAIMYKCEAFGSAHKQNKEQILLKKIKKYNRFSFTLDKMKEYGVKTVRGPRTITKSLSEELNKCK